MHRLGVAFVFLLFLTGCNRAPMPVLPLSTDTQSDLRHDHSHLHGDANRHDHDHEQSFSGTHVHPHVHGHRHAEPPHEGTILSLRWVRDSTNQDPSSDKPVPAGPHVEIVPGFPDRMWCYFLSETDEGNWSPWDIGSTAPRVQMTLEGSALTLDLVWNDPRQAYEIRLPSPGQPRMNVANAEIRLANWRFHIAGQTFDVPSEIVFRKGGLDMLLN